MSSRDVIRALGMIRLGDSVVVTARDGDAYVVGSCSLTRHLLTYLC
jgi:hypothetical protein